MPASSSQSFVSSASGVALGSAVVYGALAYLLFFLRYDLAQVLESVGVPARADA